MWVFIEIHRVSAGVSESIRKAQVTRRVRRPAYLLSRVNKQEKGRRGEKCRAESHSGAAACLSYHTMVILILLKLKRQDITEQ